MEYRIHVPAKHATNLTTTTVLHSIPCDRNATLKKVMISSRAGITHNATNNSIQLAWTKLADLSAQLCGKNHVDNYWKEYARNFAKY